MSETRTKFAIVTGGSRGIGAAHVLRLAEMGYNVAFVYLDPEKYADRAAETIEKAKALGIDCYGEECDIRDDKAVNAFVERACAKFGDQIDVLVNNAGISHTKLLVDSTIDLVEDVIDVCLKGTFRMIMAVLPHMTPYETGCIVNTGSTGSFYGLMTQTAYCAAKTGLLGMTRSLQNELAPYHIRVNTLCPGGTWTDMTYEQPKENVEAAMASCPAGFFAQPEDQADVMAFIVNNHSVWGQAIAANNGEAMFG